MYYLKNHLQTLLKLCNLSILFNIKTVYLKSEKSYNAKLKNIFKFIQIHFFCL